MSPTSASLPDLRPSLELAEHQRLARAALDEVGARLDLSALLEARALRSAPREAFGASAPARARASAPR